LVTHKDSLIRFILNEKTITTDLPPGTVMLDFIRYHQHLMGTKIGCREGDCGACTVLVGELSDGELHYQSMTCCLMPMGNAQGKHIVTIEGINPASAGQAIPDLNPIQKAMADEGATQCGFCTPGFVMSLAGFCLSDKDATQKNAVAAVDGNICRCTGYKSIERAAGKIASMLKDRNGEEPTIFVAKNKILPEYFSTIKSKLHSLQNGQADGFTIDDFRFTIIGGGTDLYVQKHDEMTKADARFVFDETKLKGIRKEGNKCILGPSVTVTELKESTIIKEAFPAFDRYAKLVSSTPIRNMATLAGNFINASPIGDFTIFFLALDAVLTLTDLSPRATLPTFSREAGSVASPRERGVRMLPLRKLYKGYKHLDKKPEEYISEISFELPGKNHLFHFEKVSKRTHLDIASVNSAILLRMKGDMIENAGISAGGVGPVPMFLEKTSGFLKGKTISEELVHETIGIAQSEISPISDARGSKEYKSFLLGQLIKAHFITLFKELHLEQTLL
jgi:xanthine dehydrogenase small subunit